MELQRTSVLQTTTPAIWSADALAKLIDIKKSILKKKIMMGFIIENNSTWDKVFRWSHNILAVSTPILIAVQNNLYGNNSPESSSTEQSSGTTAMIMSIVVAAMLKLKEYVTYDKIRDSAKEQSVKYQQLYEGIESEMRKPDGKRQLENDFIYWVSREFQHIDISDPELSNTERKKFIKLCKDKGMPYDEDLDALSKLLAAGVAAAHATGTAGSTTTSPANAIMPVSVPHVPVTDNGDSTADSKESPNSDSTANKGPSDIPSLHRVLSIQTSYDSLIKMQNISEKEERKKYRETLKKMDTKADMKWTMQRLNSLE